MESKRLAGVLLGVSMALLLAGGVALAAGVYVTVEKGCVECAEIRGIGIPVLPEENTIDVEFGGWAVGDYICLRWKIDSWYFMNNCFTTIAPGPIQMDDMAFPCGIATDTEDVFQWDELGPVSVPVSFLGEHQLSISKESPPGTVVDSDKTSFVVAEDCAAYEFVPEPGSMLLLGSGLAGLAGYAALRLRSR